MGSTEAPELLHRRAYRASRGPDWRVRRRGGAGCAGQGAEQVLHCELRLDWPRAGLSATQIRDNSRKDPCCILSENVSCRLVWSKAEGGSARPMLVSVSGYLVSVRPSRSRSRGVQAC